MHFKHKSIKFKDKNEYFVDKGFSFAKPPDYSTELALVPNRITLKVTLILMTHRIKNLVKMMKLMTECHMEKKILMTRKNSSLTH